MLKIFEWLIFGHVHKWDLLNSGNVGNKRGDTVGRWYEYQCSRCNKRKYTQCY